MSTADPADARLIDLSPAKLWLGFAVRSLRRHWRRGLLVFLLVASMSSFLALSKTKSYVVETNLTARPDLVTSAVVNPDRRVPVEADSPTLNAKETVIRESNLDRIIQQTELVKTWQASEGPVVKLKRGLFERVFGKPDPVRREEQLRKVLRSSLYVEVNDDKNSVKIGVVWSDPFEARKIVEAAQTNFLEDRRTLEVKPFEEAAQLVSARLVQADEKIAELRARLGIPEESRDPLPDSSPLRGELQIRDNLAVRLSNAQLELQAAERGFTYRYGLVTPPELPDGPATSSSKTLLMGLFGAFFVAAVTTTLTDLLKGTLIESWQVARSFDVPVLAQLRD